MYLYLGTLICVILTWHIDTCAFILAHWHVWFYLGTSTRVPLSWHIDTCTFILAHRHVCLYHGTSTHVILAHRHVSLSWHIDTCVFNLVHRHTCLYLGTSLRLLRRTNRVLAFETTHEEPFTLSQYGIGGLPSVRRCTAVLTSVLQVLVRPVSPSLWIYEIHTVFFLTPCTLMTSTTYTSLSWW